MATNKSGFEVRSPTNKYINSFTVLSQKLGLTTHVQTRLESLITLIKNHQTTNLQTCDGYHNNSTVSTVTNFRVVSTTESGISGLHVWGWTTPVNILERIKHVKKLIWRIKPQRPKLFKRSIKSTSMTRHELVQIFFGTDESKYPLPADLLYIILETAGLVKHGRYMSLFAIYFGRPDKWRERRSRNANAKSRRGFGT